MGGGLEKHMNEFALCQIQAFVSARVHFSPCDKNVVICPWPKAVRTSAHSPKFVITWTVHIASTPKAHAQIKRQTMLILEKMCPAANYRGSLSLLACLLTATLKSSFTPQSEQDNERIKRSTCLPLAVYLAVKPSCTSKTINRPDGVTFYEPKSFFIDAFLLY